MEPKLDWPAIPVLASLVFLPTSAWADPLMATQQAPDENGGAVSAQPGPQEIASSDADESVLATVGQTTVTLVDLLAFARNYPFMLQVIGTDAGRAHVLTRLIENRLINLAAMETAGLGAEATESEIREAARKYEAKEFAPNDLTPEDIRAYYQANKSTLGIPASIRVREIFVPVARGGNSEARAAARRQAAEIRAKAMSGVSFADLAAIHASTEALRLVRGDRGYLPLADFPYLSDVDTQMRTGDISDVIETPTGFVVFQVLGQRSGVPVALDVAEPEIRLRLREQSINAKKSAFFAEYGAKIGVRVVVPELASAWSPASLGRRVE